MSSSPALLISAPRRTSCLSISRCEYLEIEFQFTQYQYIVDFCRITWKNAKLEKKQKLIPGGIVEWGELFLIELVDVLADVATVILDSIQGGDVTIPRNLKDK